MDAPDAFDASGDAAAGDAVAEVEIEVNPLMHVVAPLAAVLVTMAVRKAINTAYEKSTGRSAPQPRDPNVSFWRAIAWTAVITTTAAVAEVAVYRAVNRIGSSKHRPA